MPNSGGAIEALKKRMSFGHKFHVGRHKDKNHVKDDPQRGSTTSNASTTASSEAASHGANSKASEASTATSVTTPASKMPPTREKYCTLRLSEDMAITIGDSFEPNPTCDLNDAQYFRYGPIRWPKFLRLLLVFPAINPGEPLETLLFHADLHEVPFQMLKYDRGDDAHTMHVNGLKRLVSRGLYDALYAIRERARGKAYSVLWIDELCVDQEDPVELDAHTRLKRDIVAACTGKTAVDSALNANFKKQRSRGRASRRSVEADRAGSSGNNNNNSSSNNNSSNPRLSSGYYSSRNVSNGSDISGSTEIALSSRWQSRAQSVASIRTTERIGPDSESDPDDDSNGHGGRASETEDDEEDDGGIDEEKRKQRQKVRKGKEPAKPRRNRDASSGERKPPRISISFETPEPPRRRASSPEGGGGDDGDDDDDNEERSEDERLAADGKPYHVIKSQPLAKGAEA